MNENSNAVTAQPTIEVVNPADVQIGANIRSDADLTPEFVQSIATHGVLVPVMAYRAEDGTVVVVDGQRRTLAAVQAGLAAIPALIGQSPQDADRITRQWAANEARAVMSEGDRYEAVRQLTLLGITAKQISERTGVAKETVAAVKKADKAGITAEQVAAEPTLSLLDQVALAEFAGDADALRFLSGASGDRLTRRIEQWREQQADAALLAEAEAEWTAKGATLTRVGYDDRRPEPGDLSTRDGKPLPKDPDVLCQMPGVEVGLNIERRSRRTDEGTYEVRREVAPKFVVTDAAKNGYMRRVTSDDGALMDAEAAKVARRQVRQAKEAWATAQEARRAFILTLLDAPAPFTGAERVTALWQVAGRHQPTVDTLGVFGDAWTIKARLAKETVKPRLSTKRALAISAALALMEWESQVGPEKATRANATDAAMFAALVKAGYEPSEADRHIGTATD